MNIIYGPEALASYGAVSGAGLFHGEVINLNPAFLSSILKYEAQSSQTAIATFIFDCVVDQDENCYPMIPSGAAHNEMLLGENDDNPEVSDEGKVLI